jgi:hypothetical protein
MTEMDPDKSGPRRVVRSAEPVLAAARLVARRALAQTIEVGRARLWDGTLLIVSIAVL